MPPENNSQQPLQQTQYPQQPQYQQYPQQYPPQNQPQYASPQPQYPHYSSQKPNKILLTIALIVSPLAILFVILISIGVIYGLSETFSQNPVSSFGQLNDCAEQIRQIPGVEKVDLKLSDIVEDFFGHKKGTYKITLQPDYPKDQTVIAVKKIADVISPIREWPQQNFIAITQKQGDGAINTDSEANVFYKIPEKLPALFDKLKESNFKAKISARVLEKSEKNKTANGQRTLYYHYLDCKVEMNAANLNEIKSSLPSNTSIGSYDKLVYTWNITRSGGDTTKVYADGRILSNNRYLMENIDIFEPILFEIGELGFGIDKESDEILDEVKFNNLFSRFEPSHIDIFAQAVKLIAAKNNQGAFRIDQDKVRGYPEGRVTLPDIAIKNGIATVKEYDFEPRDRYIIEKIVRQANATDSPA